MRGQKQEPVLSDSIHYELQYLDLMRRIWVEGDERVDRTGVGTRSLFGETMRFSLADDAIPLLTTKRVYWKTALREMLWFLTGDTNIRSLVTRSEEHTSELQSLMSISNAVLCLKKKKTNSNQPK